MKDSAVYASYIITEFFCILFSIGIILKANKNVGTDLQMRHFKGMSMFFIVYLISDIIWALGQSDFIPFSVTLNKVTSVTGLVAVILLTLGWCIFVIFRIGQNNTKNIKLLIGIHYGVAALDVILTITSVFTGYYFFIDDNNVYQLSNGYTFHLVLIYSFSEAVYTLLCRAFQISRSSSRKNTDCRCSL